jgi:hypothetical protein
MRQYKANMAVVSSRYSDLERRVIEFFVEHPWDKTISLPGGLGLLLAYLVKDGLLEIKVNPGRMAIGAVFISEDYRLTTAGQEFVDHLRGNEPLADIVAWAEGYWPDGRHIWYEGDSPESFAAAVKDELGLDVTKDPGWGRLIDEDEDSFVSYSFDCPAALLGDIYYSDRWPMGS